MSLVSVAYLSKSAVVTRFVPAAFLVFATAATV